MRGVTNSHLARRFGPDLGKLGDRKLVELLSEVGETRTYAQVRYNGGRRRSSIAELLSKKKHRLE
jgi:hypothetical protein